MSGVVVDARHHVRAAEALRILERRVGDELAGLEVEEPQDDRRRAEIHRDAVNRTAGAIDLLAVIESTMRSPSRVTAGSSVVVPSAGGQVQGRALDAHLAAAHRVARDLALRRPSREHWHERRKRLPLKRRGASRTRSAPRAAPCRSVTSTMHSLHLPCFTQDVGTCTPACSAAVEERRPPASTAIRCPLTVRVTGIWWRGLPVDRRLRARP